MTETLNTEPSEGGGASGTFAGSGEVGHVRLGQGGRAGCGWCGSGCLQRTGGGRVSGGSAGGGWGGVSLEIMTRWCESSDEQLSVVRTMMINLAILSPSSYNNS